MTAQPKPWDVEAIMLAANWPTLPTVQDRLAAAMGRMLERAAMHDEACFLAACYGAMRAEGQDGRDWLAPLLAEVEAAGSFEAAADNPLVRLWQQVEDGYRQDAAVGSD